MAINSQGIEIRRKSTVANTTAICSTNTLTVDSTAKIIKWSNAAADFLALNFAPNMRFTIAGTTNSNTGIYTVSSATSTSIGYYDNCTAQAVGDSLTITANRYDSIGCISGINGPSGAANVIDVTCLNSTAKQKLIGLRDEGQVSLDVFANPDATSEEAAIRTDRANRTLWTYDILFPDATTHATSYGSGMNFDAYVSGYSITAGVDAAITGNITLELTSAIKYISKV